MAIILNIDTAIETASVCLAKDGECLQFSQNTNQKEHSGWLHIAIQKACTDAGIHLKNIDAVSVTIGPGSYTGLRVGLSAAKGLCFALNIPLISINTLLLMAAAVKTDQDVLRCPLIDARRMEVFTAVYDAALTEVMTPCALVLDSTSFDFLLKKNKIIFFGNGSEKLKKIVTNTSAQFVELSTTAADMAILAEKKFAKAEFSDLAYIEPVYLKEFFSPLR